MITPTRYFDLWEPFRKLEEPTADPLVGAGEGYVVYGTANVKQSPDYTWALANESDYINQVLDTNWQSQVNTWQALEEQFKTAFGYTQRVSELCQRLEAIEATLQDVVKKLDRNAQPHRTLWVPIESFAPEPYEMLRITTAVVVPTEDGFEAGLFDANLFASGDTESEAIANLKSVILETFEALEQIGDAKLGPGPLQQKEILATLIRKR